MDTPPCPRCQVLEAELKAVRVELAEIRRRLGLKSHNSSKPPSSDGLAKPVRVKSLREKSGKLSGGQVGHKGETLEMTATPDTTIEHRPEQCAKCGAPLANAEADGVEKRQVFDIPEPHLAVTEHQAAVVICPGCGMENKGAFPEGVNAPVQYGPRIKAAAVYLSVQHFLPEDRLADLLADLFAAPVSTASLAAFNAAAAEKLAPLQETTLEDIKAAPVKHMDETSLRIGGKTQWLHVIGNDQATHYRVSEKRGDLLSGVSGIAVHDHWKPYFTMVGVTHALCNAHILRELKALIEIEKERWARHMQRLLRLMGRWQEPPGEEILARAKELYDRIVSNGLGFHEAQPPLSTRKNKRRIGHNLLIRLRDFKDTVLRFLTNSLVPFTNNQAEQDIRMMKVKQKISGGFRTTTGAQTFATIRGFLSTQRKQGNRPFQNLANAIA